MLKELMQNVQLMLSITAAIIALLATIATFFIRFIKNAKARAIAEQIVSIGKVVAPLVKQAELFANYSGREKKEYVMTKAHQYAMEHNMQFNVELLSEKIEELVELSKNVNKRDKDNVKKIVPEVVSEPEPPEPEPPTPEPQKFINIM